MKPLFFVGGGAAAVAAALWAWPTADTRDAGASPRDLFAVRRGSLDVVITENGTMVAKESQKVATNIKSESKILTLIEEGKEVQEGEVICTLDASQAQSQLEQVQLDILQTEANLKAARTELEIQIVENEATLTKARVALDRAEKEIEKYRDGEAPQERRKLEVAIKDTETEFVRAQKNLDDSKRLLEQNFVKKSEVEDHQIAFERATVQRDGARVALRMFDKYTFPMALTDLETKLADGKRELETAKKRGESTLGQKQVNVQQLEKRLKVQNQQLTERQEDLANMTLKAPCPGIVVYGNPHEPWYRDRVKVGGQVYRNFVVATIPDLRVMQVKLQVHEADISKLKVGLRARVTTDSYPGLALDGEVTKIATVASSGDGWGGSSEVKKFDVEVTLAPNSVALRPGISAKAEIHVQKIDGATYVPMQCVFAEDGQHFCHVQGADGRPLRRKVDIGTSNDVYLQILDGLVEGEQVLLYNPVLEGDRSTRSAEQHGGEAAGDGGPAATPGGDGAAEPAGS